MNREILFRAKRKSDGEWIFGNLLQTDDDGICIIQNHVPHHILKNYEVDPETVCQYTGLTDKNGNKIWENDICKIRFELPDEAQNGLYEHHNCKISWDKEWLKYVYGDKENTWDDLGECLEEDLEVIGNIYDNQELLKEE